MRRLASAVALLAALAVPAAAAEARPNVVVVMTDDQDFRSMGAMPQTRRLIAKRGTTFATSVVSFPLCCPSRATYMTGQYAHNHGVKWNNPPNGGYDEAQAGGDAPGLAAPRGLPDDPHRQVPERVRRARPDRGAEGLGRLARRRRPVDVRLLRLHAQPQRAALKTYGREPGDYSTDVYARLAERAITRREEGGQAVLPEHRAARAAHRRGRTRARRMEGTPALPAPRHADRYAQARDCRATRTSTRPTCRTSRRSPRSSPSR